jgi:outer membrane protein assembly factor BamB
MIRAFPRTTSVVAALWLVTALAPAGNWPQWRGPTSDGVSTETGLPLHWSETEHVLWKCPLPEFGASTPAIWANAIFVTTQQGNDLLLLKINKSSGQIEWTQKVGTGAPSRQPLRRKNDEERREQKFHDLHNMASPSPVTDGERVVVHFGNGDLACYDFGGKRLWIHNLQKEHGTYSIWWGHANSPVLCHDLVINVCMQDSLADLSGDNRDSYLVAYDLRTGEQRWKSLRKTEAKAEECDSYTTPLLRAAKGRTELIVVGADWIDGYDPDTGKQLWYLPGQRKARTITGPALGPGLVFATQGMKGPLLAVRLGDNGKLGDDAVAWKTTKRTPDSCCPVVWDDLLFWVSDDGFAVCRDARTGEVKWEERLSGQYKASPLAAEGRIYFLNLAGKCTVVKAAARFERLAESTIQDETIASPAVSDGRIFLRGRKALYCIQAP